MTGTTYDKLEYLNETKRQIRQAIINKGQSVSVNDTFRSYADKIAAISGGGSPVLKNETFNENGVYTVSSENIRGFGFYLDSSNKETYTGSTPLVGDYVWIKGDIWDNQVGNSVYNNIVSPNGNVPNFDQPIMTITNIVPEVRINMTCLPEEYWLMCFGEQVSIDDTTFIKQKIWDKSVSSVAIVGDYVWIEANDPLSVSLGDNVYNSTDDTDSTPDLSEPIATISMVTQGYQVSTSNLSYSLQTLNSLNIQYNETKNYDGYGQVTVDVHPQPVLKNETFTKNGTYDISLSHTYTGLHIWEGAVQSYTGLVPLVGEYAWFREENLYTVDVGSNVYNGRYIDETIAPDFESVIGIVTSKSTSRKVQFNFSWGTFLVNEYDAIQYNDEKYYKVSFSGMEQSITGVTLVGEYVWIRADNLYEITSYSPVYNSTDNTDTAPDLSETIGTIVLSEDLINLNFDTFGNSLFQYPWGEVATYTESSVYDGYRQVTVNVPGCNLESINITDNGTYIPTSQTFYGIGWNGNKEYYIGSKELVGDYIWVKNDTYDIQVGDYAYNGKLQNGNIVPNEYDILGQVTHAYDRCDVKFSFLDNYYYTLNDPYVIDGISYYKVDVSYDKSSSTYPIVGDCVWIKGETLADVQIGDSVYNSTDSTDSAPDRENIAGTLTYVHIDRLFNFDFIQPGYFLYFTVNTSYTSNIDGWNRITVNVSGSGPVNNQDISVTSDGVYTADQGYSGLGTVTVTAASVGQRKTAEELMIINDGETELTLAVSPVEANVSILSNTNSVDIDPITGSTETGVYRYSISADSFKTYNYYVSLEGYESEIGTFNGGTSSLEITLFPEGEESGESGIPEVSL